MANQLLECQSHLTKVHRLYLQDLTEMWLPVRQTFPGTTFKTNVSLNNGTLTLFNIGVVHSGASTVIMVPHSYTKLARLQPHILNVQHLHILCSFVLRSGLHSYNAHIR